MNMNQFTQKSLAAIQGAQDIALEHGNQQIEQPHLLLALVGDGEGFIPQLLTAMGMTVPSFEAAVRAEVDKLPKVSGSGRESGKVYVSQDVDRALQGAEREAQAMKDEYISVEHILLGLLAHPNAALKELFRTYRLEKEAVMQALAQVRGSQRVTSDNPEETYEALDALGREGGTVSVAAEQTGQSVALTLTAGGKNVERVPGGLTLTVPAENAGPGTVAVLVHEDGTRETIRKSTVEDGKVNIPLNGSATVEIVDNSKDFTDPVTLVYGHYMRSGTMFGSLQATYTAENGMAEHQEIIVYLPEQELHYQVFAAVPFNMRHILYYNDFRNRKVFEAFLEQVMSVRSINASIDGEAEVTAEDQLLILSTCLRGDSKQRYLVLAKRMADISAP